MGRMIKSIMSVFGGELHVGDLVCFAGRTIRPPARIKSIRPPRGADEYELRNPFSYAFNKTLCILDDGRQVHPTNLRIA